MATDRNLSHIWSAYVASGKKAYERGELDEAEQELVENLEQLEHIVHDRQVVISEVLFQLANVCRDKEKFGSAERHYERALRVRKEESGELGTLPILEQLSLCFNVQCEYEKAYQTEKCIFKLEALHGVQDARDGHCLLRIGILCLLRNQTDEAADNFRRYVRSMEKTQPATDATLLTARELLAQCLYQAGDSAESEKQYRQLLQAKQSGPGSDDDQTRRVLNGLGLALCAQGKHTDGQPLCQRALQIGEKTGGDCGLNELADVFCEQGQFAEARPLCEAAHDAACGSYKQSPVQALERHATMLESVGMTAHAEKLRKRAASLTSALVV
jgi:tetratricopeptide (TPR) repeat protein